MVDVFTPFILRKSAHIFLAVAVLSRALIVVLVEHIGQEEIS